MNHQISNLSNNLVTSSSSANQNSYFYTDTYNTYANQFYSNNMLNEQHYAVV